MNTPEYLQNVKCPLCNGKMVPRQSKHGTFWGCAAYPKCKGTRDSNGMSKEDKLKESNEEYD